jgi:hypothetical protein
MASLLFMTKSFKSVVGENTSNRLNDHLVNLALDSAAFRNWPINNLSQAFIRQL